MKNLCKKMWATDFNLQKVRHSKVTFKSREKFQFEFVEATAN